MQNNNDAAEVTQTVVTDNRFQHYIKRKQNVNMDADVCGAT
jgi:hypothetical protein